MARTDPQINIRVTAEFKKKLETTAIQNGRSMNAEVVSRLEASFKQRHVDLIEETAKASDAVLDEATTYAQLRQQYFQKQLIKLDFYLERLDLKIGAFKYLIDSIEHGRTNDALGADSERALMKYQILLEDAELERKNMQAKLMEAYEESDVDPNFIIGNEIKHILNQKD